MSYVFLLWKLNHIFLFDIVEDNEMSHILINLTKYHKEIESFLIEKTGYYLHLVILYVSCICIYIYIFVRFYILYFRIKNF